MSRIFAGILSLGVLLCGSCGSNGKQEILTSSSVSSSTASSNAVSSSSISADAEPSLLDRNLTGMWLYELWDKEYHLDTQEYASESYRRSYIYIEDTPFGIAVLQCEDFSESALRNYSVTKTAGYLYWYLDSPFKLAADGTLHKHTEFVPQYESSINTHLEHKLTWVNDSFKKDRGAISFSEPAVHQQYDHICLNTNSRSAGYSRSYSLTGPFFSGREGLLGISLVLVGEVSPGIYEADSRNYSEVKPVELNVYYDTIDEVFKLPYVSNRLSVVTLNEVSDSRIVGGFSVRYMLDVNEGQLSEDYVVEGEFDIDLDGF